MATALPALPITGPIGRFGVPALSSRPPVARTSRVWVHSSGISETDQVQV